jgi:uncharacterized protein YceK
MTDTETLYDEQDAELTSRSVPEDPERRGLITLLAVAVVIVVVVLLLLMLRGCGSVLNSANRSSSGNEIVPVAGGRPVDGAISVWMSAGTDLQNALSAAAVRNSGIVDMGGGRFVVSVPTGTEVEAARLLREIDGVYDAGRVYSSDTPTP